MKVFELQVLPCWGLCFPWSCVHSGNETFFSYKFVLISKRFFGHLRHHEMRASTLDVNQEHTHTHMTKRTYASVIGTQLSERYRVCTCKSSEKKFLGQTHMRFILNYTILNVFFFWYLLLLLRWLVSASARTHSLWCGSLCVCVLCWCFCCQCVP